MSRSAESGGSYGPLAGAGRTPKLSIGIGCRSACEAGTVVTLVKSVTAGLDRSEARMFTLDRKLDSTALREAARRLGLPLAGLSAAALRSVSAHVTVSSPRVLAATGAPSVAEAAALVGAGPGATLLVPRTVLDGVTCAVATAEPVLATPTLP